MKENKKFSIFLYDQFFDKSNYISAIFVFIEELSKCKTFRGYEKVLTSYSNFLLEFCNVNVEYGNDNIIYIKYDNNIIATIKLYNLNLDPI